MIVTAGFGLSYFQLLGVPPSRSALVGAFAATTLLSEGVKWILRRRRAG